jgi:hypothetical protein
MSIPKPNLKCPLCSKTPNYDRVQIILTDAMAYQDNRPFSSDCPTICFWTAICLYRFPNSRFRLWLSGWRRRQWSVICVQNSRPDHFFHQIIHYFNVVNVIVSISISRSCHLSELSLSLQVNKRLICI